VEVSRCLHYAIKRQVLDRDDLAHDATPFAVLRRAIPALAPVSPGRRLEPQRQDDASATDR
jgi:hypothetical protein